MNTQRLFIGIETPDQVRHAIIEALSPLRSIDADVRWEPVHKLHLTVRFLGDTDAALIPRLSDALGTIASDRSPAQVRYVSLGCFPGPRDPRVLWIGIEDPEQNLTELNRQIEAAVVAIGFTPEDRRFHPHVTVGRVRSRRNLGRLLAKMESVTFESTAVTLDAVRLIRSDLRPGGSVYTTLQAFPFFAK